MIKRFTFDCLIKVSVGQFILCIVVGQALPDKNYNLNLLKFFVFVPFLSVLRFVHIVIITDNFAMDKILLKKLAKRIKELRRIHGYTQDDLSHIAQIGRSTLGNIETAQNDITFSKLNRIAKAFNLSLSEFLNF